MGYGWNTRSAEDVQRHNRSHYDFEKIKFKYENIKPLRGKRSHLDVRPHGERDRSHERIVKVSDNEYYITNTAYAYPETHPEHYIERNKEHNRVMTFVMAGDIEYLTVHAPRQYWGEEMKKPFAERRLLDRSGFIAPSNFYFYYYNLPVGLGMTKYGSKAYLEVRGEAGSAHKYYTLMQGDVVLTRKQGEELFKPLVVHRERKLILDRTKTKEIRKQLEPFVNYVSIMAPLMDYKHIGWSYKNPFTLNKKLKQDVDREWEEVVSKSWSELVSMNGDELPEYWYNMAQCYRSRIETRKYNWDTKEYETLPITTEKVKSLIYDDVYRQALPFKVEDIELGVAFKNNKYQSWGGVK